MNNLLSFLQTATIEDVKPIKRGSAGGARKQRQPNPNLLAIRLFRDGSVFPSEAAIEKFNLEYKHATIVKESLPLKAGETVAKTKNVYSYPNGTGNGFDVIDSRVWGEFKGTEGMAMLFITATPKDAAKVDLFGTTNYEDDGTPKSSVSDQGAATFGKDVLIPAVESIYGVVFHVPSVDYSPEVKDASGKIIEKEVYAVQEIEGVEFVDLVIFDSLGTVNISEKYSKPIIYAPKRVIRGKDAGKPDYIRRENAVIYGLAPATMVVDGYIAETKVDEADEPE